MKMMKALLVMALVLALATPALAELKLNGYFRVQATAQNSTGIWAFDVADDAPTTTFVDQRLRLKLTNTFNDKVKLVYYVEADTPWGLAGKGGIGGAGMQGADGVLLESKNIYLNFQTAGWDFTVGIQNMGDNAGDIVIDNDVAGVTAKTKLGAVDLTLRYAKLYENDGSTHLGNSWNDEAFYAVQTSFTLSDTARLGFDVLYFDDSNPATENEQTYVSIDGDFNFGDANVTGFVLYGNQDYVDGADGDNWAASAQYATKVGNGNFSVRGIYYADADNEDDLLFNDDHGTGFQFYKEGLMLFLTDIYYNNGTQGALFMDAVSEGHGLTALTLKGNLGLDSGYYLKYAAGYFMANDEDGKSGTVEGKSMGFEADLMFGKKINDKIDISIRGAYAFLGDFYDDPAGNPDNPWKTVAMINVGF